MFRVQRTLESGRTRVTLSYNSRRDRALSSVGRAPARQAGGHWFEPSSAHLLNPLHRGGFPRSERSNRHSLVLALRADSVFLCQFSALHERPQTLPLTVAELDGFRLEPHISLV